MAKITIVPHSIVDLITNSSTTIYTHSPNVDLVKRIFGAVLAAHGVKNRVEDLFTFTIEYDPGVYVGDGYPTPEKLVIEGPDNLTPDQKLALNQLVNIFETQEYFDG